jgi:hypothetical protein
MLRNMRNTIASRVPWADRFLVCFVAASSALAAMGWYRAQSLEGELREARTTAGVWEQRAATGDKRALVIRNLEYELARLKRQTDELHRLRSQFQELQQLRAERDHLQQQNQQLLQSQQALSSALRQVQGQPQTQQAADITSLIDMLEDPSTANRAAHLLSLMGDEVVPALLIAITNADEQVRLRTVVDLGWRAANAAEVVDALLDRLGTDPESSVRSASALALGNLPNLPADAMEVMLKALDDPIPHVASNAALALGNAFGPRAESAVPNLIEHWHRTGWPTSEALTMVDPEAAKRLGAMQPPNPYE